MRQIADGLAVKAGAIIRRADPLSDRGSKQIAYVLIKQIADVSIKQIADGLATRVAGAITRRASQLTWATQIADGLAVTAGAIIRRAPLGGHKYLKSNSKRMKARC